MGRFEDYKPVMALIVLQCCYAGLALFSRATLLSGMSPQVFLLYRQAFATIAILPFAIFSRRTSKRCSLDLRSFALIFIVALIGVTMNQNLYFEGLYLTSSSMASAMSNLVPAITFLMAFLSGYEKVNIRSVRSLAKILGTIFCVVGALAMALLRGPKLLNSESGSSMAISLMGLSENNQNQKLWLLGCLFLFGSTLCWAIWLILQVRLSAIYPDHISSSAWICFFGTLQCAAITFVMEKDPSAWLFPSYSDFVSCLYAGVVASGLAFFIQSWAVSKRGPLFSAMFNPLCTVIVTVLAALFLQEEIYTGTLLGGIGVVIGLYVVLWGKTSDVEHTSEEGGEEEDDKEKMNSEIRIEIEDSLDNAGMCKKNDLEEPLLFKDSSFAEEIRTHDV